MRVLKLKTTAMAGTQDERTLTTSWSVPEDFDELIKVYSPQVVYEGWLDAATIAAQAFNRGKMKPQGKEKKRLTNDEIVSLFSKWEYHPGTKGDPVKKQERARSVLSSMTEEQVATLIADYNAGKFAGRSMTQKGDVAETKEPGKKPVTIDNKKR